MAALFAVIFFTYHSIFNNNFNVRIKAVIIAKTDGVKNDEDNIIITAAADVVWAKAEENLEK